jgi:hypothetical protein
MTAFPLVPTQSPGGYGRGWQGWFQSIERDISTSYFVIARLDRAIQRKEMDPPVKPEDDGIEFDSNALRSWRRVLNNRFVDNFLLIFNSTNPHYS